MLETTTNTDAIYYDLTFHEIIAADLAYINQPAISELLQSEDPYLQRLAASVIAKMPHPGVDDPKIKRRVVEIVLASAIADINPWQVNPETKQRVIESLEAIQYPVPEGDVQNGQISR